jgi:hypothetical protein
MPRSWSRLSSRARTLTPMTAIKSGLGHNGAAVPSSDVAKRIDGASALRVNREREGLRR